MPMPTAMQPIVEEDPQVYDLFGIGFGPANVALAISLTESQEVKDRNLKFGFLERRPSFAWHPALLLPGAQLQVSPFKDLATMRDPTSSFTFVNYLHKMGRLSASINRDATIPSRREWSAYLTWCAERLDHVVSYGEDVLSIEPVENAGNDKACVQHAVSEAKPVAPGGHARLLRITSRIRGNDAKVRVRLARNVTVGVGGSPSVPEQFKTLYPALPWEHASRIIHSGTFLPSLNAIEPELAATVERRLGRSSPASRSNWPLRFAVIGAGQSSAEMAMHLRRTFPAAHVQMIFRASAIVPSDDSAFVNSAAFDPERTDDFWKSGEQERDDWRREFKRTNYSVVRTDVLNALSEMLYDQQIELPQLYPGSDGPPEGRLDVHPNTFVETAAIVKDGDDEQVRLVLSSLKTADAPTTIDVDAVFMGTGFIRRPDSLPFLHTLKDHFPILDGPETAAQRRADLGFSDDDDSRTMAGENEAAKELVRERVRGITRDYRLVAYQSDSFRRKASVASSSTSPSLSASRRGSAAVSRRNSDTSETTLANAIDEAAEDDSSRPRFEPSVYSFGGNEATHGLSDSLMSICAWRAGEVTESFLKRLPKTSENGRATTNASQAAKVIDDLINNEKPARAAFASPQSHSVASKLSSAQNGVAQLSI
ncbi:unnamed protein product [Parajaminaea phylloscopi]